MTPTGSSTFRPIVHNVQGCQYSEFRGIGHPSADITRTSQPGDVYLDVQRPRGVWVFSGTDWMQWNSMADSQSVPHPTLPRILCPNAERFAWVSNKGFAGFKRQVDLLLDGRKDTAHVHVSNILDNEDSNTAVPADQDKSSSEGSDDQNASDNSDHSSSDRSSSECDTDARTKDEDEVNVITTGDDDAMVVDDHKHDVSDRGNSALHEVSFTECCYNMRQANFAIDKAASVGPASRRLIAGLKGVEFPQSAETVNWPVHNVETYLPFTGVSGNKDRDSEWVRYMANASIAHVEPDPFAVVLTLPQPLSPTGEVVDPKTDVTSIRETFSRTIRYHLSNNRAVVVHKWYPEMRCAFSVDEIGMIRSSTANTVHWQDAKERARNFDRTENDVIGVVKHMRFADFILDAHDVNVCGNVLDLQNLQQEAPHWINHLADDINSLYLTRSDHYGNSKSTRPTAKLDLSRLGPQVILHDMWRAQGWDIATHGGFLTYTHHDASGLATFLYPRSGAKVWGLVRIKPDALPKTRDELFDLYEHIVDDNWDNMRQFTSVKTILLEEGDVLIQPPGAWHTVYTPNKGMTSGGHIVMYDTLHLMEQIRAYDSSIDGTNTRRGSYSTNETHTVDRQLIRMMLAMPDLVRIREFRRRPVLAHIVMVDSVKGAGNGEAMPDCAKNEYLVKETQNERMAAMKIVQAIMKKFELDMHAILRELSNRDDADWYSPGEVLDLDFLHSMIQHAV